MHDFLENYSLQNMSVPKDIYLKLYMSTDYAFIGYAENIYDSNENAIIAVKFDDFEYYVNSTHNIFRHSSNSGIDPIYCT